MEPAFDPGCLKHRVDLIPMRSSNAATKVPKLGSGMVNGLQEAILQYIRLMSWRQVGGEIFERGQHQDT